MKILVTGAAGFIGSYLTRALIEQGYTVVGLDNFHPYYDRRAKEWNLDLTRLAANQKPKIFEQKDITPIYAKLREYSDRKKTKKSGTFLFYEGDIRDTKCLDKIFNEQKIDQIVHLAAMAGVPYSIEDPKLYTDVNINGTVNLLEQARTHKIKNFIFASSSSVYGATEKVPFKEIQYVDNPISPYAATKRMGEIICYTYSYLFNIPTTCLRFFTVYGPLQRPYGMAIQKFIKLTDQNKPMSIYGDGEMARDFTYIHDTVSGIISALKEPRPYTIYNLGNSYPVTVNKLADLIIEYMKKGKKDYMKKPPTEVPITYADISKAQEELGYSPKISIREGLKRQIEIYNMMPKWYKQLPA